MLVLEERTNQGGHHVVGGGEAAAVGKEVPEEASDSVWTLPQGAEEIIKTIAAEKILLDLLHHFDPPQVADHVAIQRLVASYPVLAKRTFRVNVGKQRDRHLSLLAAVCLLGPPLELIRLIHGLHREAIAQTESAQDSLPLHYACQSSSLDVVQYLVEQYPEGVRARQRDGNLPIHLVCRFNCRQKDLINFLIESWPSSCFSCCSKGWFPLHCAVEGRASLPTIVRLHEASPRIAGYLNERGWTPLHIACSQRGNSTVVRYLASSASHTLHIRDSYGNTPLFVAVRYQTLSAVRVLLDSMRSRPAVNVSGRTILHEACLHNTAEVVDLIATRFPAMVTCRTTDYDRYTPLHEVCCFHQENEQDDPLNIIQVLTQHNRNLVLQRDREGRKALHLARRSNSSLQVIQYLIDLEI